VSEHSTTVRVLLSGSWVDLEWLGDALARHEHVQVERPGERETAAAAPDVVLHVAGGETLAHDELDAVHAATGAPIVLLARTPALLEEVLGADVAGVLLLPQPIESVVFALRKARRAAPEASARGGEEVVTIFSPKGGTGKTVTSTNLAVTVAQRTKKRVLLLDLDLQFGDAAIMLGLEPTKTIYDLVAAPGELDPEKLARYPTPHPSGLDVLAAPLRPEEAELVTEEKLARVLVVARRCYDLVVVDTSPFFYGPMLQTLDLTDDLLLVCTPDVPTLKNVRLSMHTLELLSFSAERIRVVLNRAKTDVGLTRREVETALELKVAYELPSDGGVPLSVNRGEPIVLDDPKSAFARAIVRLAESRFGLDEGAAPPESSGNGHVPAKKARGLLAAFGRT
jgi:Flp pilus assembly CpaE family ATPase